jgi:hypothetical protein
MSRRLAAAFSGALLALSSAGTTLARAEALCRIPETLEVSERDRDRIAGVELSRSRGLAAALTSDDAVARAELSALFLAGAVQTNSIPQGNYRCRTIKSGGLGLVIYGFFSCEIRQDGGAYQITKTTGSQQLSGTLTPAGDGLLYRGALNYSDEGPIAYDGASDRDQVGCLYRTGSEAETYLLELPSPAFESYHDVLELRPE